MSVLWLISVLSLISVCFGFREYYDLCNKLSCLNMLRSWWMNHVCNYYMAHSGGISRFIRSVQINASRRNVCKQPVADQVGEKSANSKCVNVTMTMCVGLWVLEMWRNVAVVSVLFCLWNYHGQRWNIWTETHRFSNLIHRNTHTKYLAMHNYTSK